MAKILVVEDDPATSQLVEDWLRAEQHAVDVAFDGEEGWYLANNYQYELIILDWDLPKLSGIELLRRYRDAKGDSPVIMLTGHKELNDKTSALDDGVDDYITKPFHLKELSSRVRAVLRRTNKASSNTLRIGTVEVDTTAARVLQNGEEVILLPKEYALLEFLMRHPNQMYSPESLLERVWQSDSDATIAAVRTVVTRLRKKLGDSDQENACLIQTVWGQGYRLNARET